MAAPSAENEPGVVEPRQRHGEARAVLVTVVEADEGVVGVGADHAFGGIGDHVTRGEAGIAALHSLGDIVADTGYAKGEAYEAGAVAARLDLLRELVGVDIAEITFQQRHTDSDLGLVEIISGEKTSEATLAVFPGLAIVVTVLAFNLLGDTMRDLLDPRLRGSD